MRKSKIKIILNLLIAVSIISIQINIYAHSGRTDSNGGHKDKNNVSGLGPYHYHCGGYPAHLHPNGVCPYSSSTSTPSSSSSSQSSSTSSSLSSNKTNATTPATNIQINESITSINVGESKKITATISPSNATDKSVTWKSSDDSIATVDSNGKIVAKKAGIVNIIASTSNGKTSTLQIIVNEEKKTGNTNITKIFTTNKNYVTNNVSDNDSDGLHPVGSIIALGLLGGSGYLNYKKHKKSK